MPDVVTGAAKAISKVSKLRLADEAKDSTKLLDSFTALSEQSKTKPLSTKQTQQGFSDALAVPFHDDEVVKRATEASRDPLTDIGVLEEANQTVAVRAVQREEFVNQLQRNSWLNEDVVSTQEKVAAIQKFTTGPQKELTRYLNAKAAGQEVTLSREAEEVLLGWDRAIVKTSEPLQKQKPIYRGVNMSSDSEFNLKLLGGAEGQLKDGVEFSFPAHTSFSFEQKVAFEFSEVGQQQNRVLFVVKEAQGTKGIDVQSVLSDSLEEGTNAALINSNAREAEFIVQRGQPFVVNSIVDKGSTKIVNISPKVPTGTGDFDAARAKELADKARQTRNKVTQMKEGVDAKVQQ